MRSVLSAGAHLRIAFGKSSHVPNVSTKKRGFFFRPSVQNNLSFMLLRQSGRTPSKLQKIPSSRLATGASWSLARGATCDWYLVLFMKNAIFQQKLRPSWTEMDLIGPDWTKFVHIRPDLSKFAQTRAKWNKMDFSVHFGHQLVKMDQNGPD